MSKLIVICNHADHANRLLRLNKIRPIDAVIITPEETKKLYGFKNFDYYCIRPLYAREKSYIDTHGGMEVTIEQAVMGYAQP